MRKRRIPEFKFLIDYLKSPEARYPPKELVKTRKTSIRLTKKYDKELERLSKRLGKSKSELIREAINLMLLREALRIYLETLKKHGKN